MILLLQNIELTSFLRIFAPTHSKNASVFNVLCSLYEKSLNRDPAYKDYLGTIGEIYFGQERKQKPGGGGLFSNLFQSLFANNPEGGGGVGDNRQTTTDSNSSHFESSLGGGGPSTSSSASAAPKTEDVDLD